MKGPQPIDAEFFCVSCRTPFLNSFPLDSEGRCTLCRRGRRGFDAAYCYGSYEGTLRELIHLYKYGRVKTLAKPLGDLLAAALPREEHFDAVAAVPLHWRRKWRRGFNQSELLARLMAARYGIPVVKALRRVRATETQAGLSNTRRRQNVAAAFACGRGAKALQGQRILLIDDVMTTGSTAAACARVLKSAGAAKVALLAVARVDRRMEGWRSATAPSGEGVNRDVE